jgi:hypothetical protein
MDPMDMLPSEKKEEPKHKGGMFGGAPKDAPFDFSVVTQEVANVGRRLRTLEERTANLVRKGQIDEQNMLSGNKKVAEEIKALISDISEIKKMNNETHEHIRQIAEELRRCAKKEDVKVLQKYMDLWEPLNFVTRNEVEKIIQEILDKKTKV